MDFKKVKLNVPWAYYNTQYIYSTAWKFWKVTREYARRVSKERERKEKKMQEISIAYAMINMVNQGAINIKKNYMGLIKKFQALVLDLPTSMWPLWCHTDQIEYIFKWKWQIASYLCTIIQPNIILSTICDISSQIKKPGHMMSYTDSWWQCR